MMIANPIAHWSEDAVFILDFMNGTLPTPVTFTRASNGWYFDSNGYLAQASTDVARFDYGSPGSASLQGILIEESRTNKALRCRDLTQSAWVKTNATASLNQTGLDNSSNTASLLTATAANATALQTVTQSATNSTFSVYLKRITGTGTIQLTQDNGSTYTTVTLTSSWQRFTLAAQSTTNPVFGIKIVTSGDAVAWDCAQFEAGKFVTSPILTTTASVTRSGDAASVTSIPWFNATVGTFMTQAIMITNGPNNNQTLAEFSDGTTNNRIGNYVITSDLAQGYVSVSGTFNVSGGAVGGPPSMTIFKQAMKYKSGSNVAAYATNIDTAGTVGTSTLPSGISQLRIGDRSDGIRPINGWIRRFKYWNYGLTNAQLQRITL